MKPKTLRQIASGMVTFKASWIQLQGLAKPFKIPVRTSPDRNWATNQLRKRHKQERQNRKAGR